MRRRIGEYLAAENDVGIVGVLREVMADPANRRYEHHRCWKAQRQDLRIVARSRRHAHPAFRYLRTCRRFNCIQQFIVHHCWHRARQVGELHSTGAALLSLGHQFVQFGFEALENRAVGIAKLWNLRVTSGPMQPSRRGESAARELQPVTTCAGHTLY